MVTQVMLSRSTPYSDRRIPQQRRVGGADHIAVMQAAPERDGQSGDRLAEVVGQHVSREGHLAHVEIEAPHHLPKGLGQRIELDELQAHAIGGDVAIP
jgi:hypothetical protein